MEAVKYRSSLIVPSVLELAKEKMDAVPSRYIRSHNDPEEFITTALLPTVPIIDMSALLSGSLEELEKLDSAGKNWGFFQMDSVFVLEASLMATRAPFGYKGHKIIAFENLQVWQRPPQPGS